MNAAEGALGGVRGNQEAANFVRQFTHPYDGSWAARYVRAGDATVPVYGSPAWERLADSDPHKVAACVRAAEAWRTYWSPEEHAHRLRVELDAARAEEERAEWPADVVDQVHRRARRPSYAELCRRRGEPGREARAREHERRMDGLLSRPYADEGDVHG